MRFNPIPPQRHEITLCRVWFNDVFLGLGEEDGVHADKSQIGQMIGSANNSGFETGLL